MNRLPVASTATPAGIIQFRIGRRASVAESRCSTARHSRDNPVREVGSVQLPLVTKGPVPATDTEKVTLLPTVTVTKLFVG